MSNHQSQSYSQAQPQPQPQPQPPVRGPLLRLIHRLTGRMKFPYVFLILLGVLAVDAFFPDPILLVDEIILGLMTVLFGLLRERKQPPPDQVDQTDDEPYVHSP